MAVAVIVNRDMLNTYPRLGRSTQKRYRNLCRNLSHSDDGQYCVDTWHSTSDFDQRESRSSQSLTTLSHQQNRAQLMRSYTCNVCKITVNQAHLADLL